MKVLFLCAGYGTRLERDLQSSGEFSECLGRPKALLPIGEKALISYWFEALDNLEAADMVDEIIIVTNDKFNEQFYKSRKWYSETSNMVSDKKLKILNDGSTSNDTRLGAVADIQFALNSGDKKDDLDVLVIAGDTLFLQDFKLEEFIRAFNDLKKKTTDGPVALIVACPCPEENVSKHGIIELDSTGKVTSFLEKPKPTETSSRLQSPCFYILDAKCQGILDEFLEASKDLPLEKKDATGNFLAYLIPKACVHAFQTRGRYDVGNLASYKECLNGMAEKN